jgi:PAS domain S-box-containing protein
MAFASPAPEGERRPSQLRKALVVLGVLVLLGSALWGIYRYGAEVKQEIDSLAIANSDSQQWSLAQLDVEFARMQIALLRSDPQDPASIAEFSRRFDVFYSRVQTVLDGHSFRRIVITPVAIAQITQLQDFLRDAAGLIDAPDTPFAQIRPDLMARSDALAEAVRSLSLLGVREFAAQAKEQRERVFNALMRLAILTALLMAVLAGGFLGLWLLWRFGMRQARSLRAAKQRLEAVIGTALDAVIVADQRLRVIEFNAAAEAIFGVSRDDAMGRDLADLILPEGDAAARAGALAHLRGTAGPGLVQLDVCRHDRTVFPAELSATNTRIGRRDIYVLFLRDISSRVAARQELIAARDTAMAGERAKAAFIAVMSHELRTPLNGLLGTLEILQGTSLDDRQRDFVEAMAQAGQILLHHVNDVLDVERLDAGKLTFSRVPFDPEQIARQIIDTQRSAAAARGNDMEVEVLGPPIGRVLGDPVRVRQVLLNLIGNAAKFTTDGVIRIELEYHPARSTLEIRVIDTGIGISRSDLPTIFDDFVSIDADLSRENTGTGLGLGIVRRLVQAMGGTVDVESELGEGSVFWLSLPAPRADLSESVSSPTGPAEAPPPVERADLPALEVLLVEDNTLNRTVLSELLRQGGHRVTAARNGRECIDLASEKVFDVILMDLNMPVLNGLEATRILRATPGPNQHTQIIAVTANVLPEMAERLLQAGCNQVTSKPVTRKSLAAALTQLHLSASDKNDDPASPLDETVRADLEAVFGSEEFAQLQADFLAEGRRRLARMQQLAAAGTLPDYAQVAHKFAGSAAMLGLTGLHAGLRRHEILAGQGDLPEIRQALPPLATLWAEAEAMLATTPGARPTTLSDPGPGRARLH